MNLFDEFAAAVLREANLTDCYDEGVLEELGIGDKYLTYEVSPAAFGDAVALSASLWCRSTSWEEISQKADEIAAYLGNGGRTIRIDDGAVWIKPGSPFAQRMAVDQDYSMRRIYINITAEFFTAT